MSHLPGNPNAENFRRSHGEFGSNTIASEGLTDATIIWQGLMDHSEATLALAYEQRTANLIAVAKWTNGLDVASNLMDQVAERMGLKEWE